MSDARGTVSVGAAASEELEATTVDDGLMERREENETAGVGAALDTSRLLADGMFAEDGALNESALLARETTADEATALLTGAAEAGSLGTREAKLEPAGAAAEYEARKIAQVTAEVNLMAGESLSVDDVEWGLRGR